MMRWVPLFLLLVLMVSPGIGAAPQSRVICAIDMGSNTFRRIVGSFANGQYQQRSIEKRTLSVGDDLATHGRISDAKLAEIDKTLADFRAACEANGAAPVVAIGTAAFRDAPNGRKVIDIAAARGVIMEIATEARESELAYLVGSLGRDDYAVIDNGSRSIELVAGSGGMLRHVVLNLGYRFAYETFFAAAEDPAAACSAFRDRLKQEVTHAPFMKGKRSLVGVEFGEMAELLFEPAAVEGRVFTLEAPLRRASLSRLRTAEVRMSSPGKRDTTPVALTVSNSFLLVRRDYRTRLEETD
jgi:Ppx/GppA phosphatase family